MLVVGRHDFYGLFRNFQFTFIFTFFGRCFEFFVGMWLAKQILKKPKLFKVVTFKNTLIGFTAITICIVLLSLVKLQYNTQQSIYHPLGLFVNNLLLPLGIIIFFKAIITEENIFTKILSSKLFEILGKSSYAFYLIHLGIFPDFLTRLNINNYFARFIILVALSIVLYKLVEEKLNVLIRSFYSTTNKNLAVEKVGILHR